MQARCESDAKGHRKHPIWVALAAPPTRPSPGGCFWAGGDGFSAPNPRSDEKKNNVAGKRFISVRIQLFLHFRMRAIDVKTEKLEFYPSAFPCQLQSTR